MAPANPWRGLCLSYPLIRQSLSQGAGGSTVDDPDIRANEYLDVSRTVGSDFGYRARVSIARAMAQGFASPYAMAMHSNLVILLARIRRG